MKRSELIKKLIEVRRRCWEKAKSFDSRIEGYFTNQEDSAQWHYWVGQQDAIGEVLKLLNKKGQGNV